MKRHPEFSVHKLNEDGIEKAVLIRDAFDNLLTTLESLCFSSREFSVTKTKLEEACFFAKKAMAVNLVNQQTQGE